jgi:type II secretory ATPase GspE/PulE/Tfp pilus assembly ATPase PilB-like protein
VGLALSREAGVFLFDAGAEPGESERGDAPPAVRAVDELHARAISLGASDIHIEPASDGGRVRLRVDGVLREIGRLAPELFRQVVSRVKLLAAMDIADRRQPQDGRYQIDAQQRCVDARVSSMPTIDGEKLVVRLLDMRARVPDLEQLGMPPALLARYRGSIHCAHGFVVVSGPTGSGKTTTLYASLAERNLEGQHLCTIEDPVEIRIGGVAQAQVNPRAGLTFASALRAVLRQDPNVIMVGEIRDAETAGVAMSAALSGQLVLASLHASDALRTVERLVELGLERGALAAGLSGILAQRLVRTLCAACRRPCSIDAGSAMLLEIECDARVYEARGCTACGGSGYMGRTGVFEFLTVDEPLCAAIASVAAPAIFAEIGRSSGYRPMRAEAASLLLAGTTSVDEVRRVLAVGSA